MTQIILNHITRMTYPRICIAGIEVEVGKHVRPVTAPGDPITRSLLAEEGGPLEIGARIELGATTSVARPPETEDQRCRTTAFRSLGTLDPDEYLELLDSVAAPDLASAFGEPLQRVGRTYAVGEGEGSCSLVCVRASGDERLTHNYGLRLRDSEGALIGVTDLRFFRSDHKTPLPELVMRANRRLMRGVPVYLMFGLSRAWAKNEEDEPRHWLQLNGICLGDSPLGIDA